MVGFYDYNDLYNAVTACNVSKARRCLKGKVPPNYCPILSPGRILSLLSLSIIRKDEEMVRLLLEFGADVHGEPEKAFVEVAKKARDKAYADRAKGGSGVVTSIHGKPIELKYAWETPLHIAAAQRQPKMVQLLFDEGNADPNVMNSSGFPPLYFSLYYKDQATTRLIVDQCARLRVPCTSLDAIALYSAETGQHELLADILLLGGSIQALGPNEQLVLYKAAASDNAKALAVLVARGANIEAQCVGMTAFFEAAADYQKDAMKKLLDVGADIDARDKSGCTALHRAAMAGHRPLVQFLLDNGADPDIHDADGWSCLYAAMVGQHELITKLLLDVSGIASLAGMTLRGAGVSNGGGDGNTPLHQAASTGSVVVTRHILLGYGGTRRETIDALNRAQETPLCLAAANGHRAVARVLLSRGADANHAGPDGRRPLWRAAERGCWAIVRDLVSHGARITPSCVPSYLGASTNENHITVARLLKSVAPDVAFPFIDTPSSSSASASSQQQQQPIDYFQSDNIKRKPLAPNAFNSASALLTDDQRRMFQKQDKPLPEDPTAKKSEAEDNTTTAKNNKSGADAGEDNTENNESKLNAPAAVPVGAVAGARSAKSKTSKASLKSADPFEASIPDERPVTINHNHITNPSSQSSPVGPVVSGALQMIGSIVGALI